MPELIAGIQSLRRRAMLISSARKLSRSPSLRSATFLAAGGVGFAVGNILLARVLPEAQFGAVALVLSLIQVGAALAAHGLPNLVVRHQLNASSGLLRQSTFSSLLAGAVVLAIAAALYDLDAFLALMLGVTVVLAGTGRVAGALFQSRGRFGFSLFLIQIHNWVLLASVPIVLLFRRPFAELVTAVILCSYLATSVLGWRLAARLPTGRDATRIQPRVHARGAERSGTGPVEQHFFPDRPPGDRSCALPRGSRALFNRGGDRGIGVPHAADWRGLLADAASARVQSAGRRRSFSSGTRPHWFSRWARSPRSWS